MKSPQVFTFETDLTSNNNRNPKRSGGSGSGGGNSNGNGSNGGNGNGQILDESFLLTENNFFILQENGYKIKIK